MKVTDSDQCTQGHKVPDLTFHSFMASKSVDWQALVFVAQKPWLKNHVSLKLLKVWSGVQRSLCRYDANAKSLNFNFSLQLVWSCFLLFHESLNMFRDGSNVRLDFDQGIYPSGQFPDQIKGKVWQFFPNQCKRTLIISIFSNTFFLSFPTTTYLWPLCCKMSPQPSDWTA